LHNLSLSFHFIFFSFSSSILFLIFGFCASLCNHDYALDEHHFF